ncbi:MAG: CusA/CzcA family heavy metal efflux RND transporter, partial [Pseudomonas sp. PGPPP4]
MFERILRFAIEQRWLVLLATLGIAALGIYSYRHLPIDAVPDITNVQVQINAEVPGASPLEVEQRVTYPLETAMAGLPGLERTRSLSRSGFAQISVIFADGTDLFFARQQVSERLQGAREALPEGVEVNLGPLSTGLGEIFLWTVKAAPQARRADGEAYTLTDLREIQDWIVKPQLRTVPGVAEVNTIGGYAKEYQIAPDPKRLAGYRITLEQLAVALERNNANVGAGFIERAGEQLVIRVPGQLASVEDIATIVLATVDGTPVRVRDVATVGVGQELRSGAATENGEEAVLGTVFMRVGENSREVALAVAGRLAQINRNLPEGVQAVAVYDRTTLVDKAIATVRKNLVEGALLVIAVLFVFLGNLRAALITALVIPLSMLFTFSGMAAN